MGMRERYGLATNWRRPSLPIHLGLPDGILPFLMVRRLWQAGHCIVVFLIRNAHSLPSLCLHDYPEAKDKLLSKNRLTCINDVSIRTISRISLAIIGVVFSRLIGAVTQIILARRLGSDGFGLYTALYAMLSPVSIMASLGLDTWLLSKSGHPQIYKLIGRVFSLRILLISSLLFTVAPLVSYREPALSLTVVYIGACGLIGDLLITTADSALRSSIRLIESTVLQIIAPITLFIFIVLTKSNDLSEIITYRVVATTTAVVFLYVLLNRMIHFMWQPRQWIYILKDARFFFTSEFMAYLTLRADLFLVALVLGSTATAIYAPVLTLINTTFLMPSIVSQILIPMISRQPESYHLRRIITKLAIVGSFLYGLFWLTIFTFGAHWLIRTIYGRQYLNSVLLLQIMSLIPMLKSFNFCWATIMVVNNRQLLRTKLQLIGATVSVLGNAIALPLLGTKGVSWVNIITELTLFCSYGYGAFITITRKKLDESSTA